MNNATRDHMPARSSIGFKRSAAFLLGLLVLVTSFQVLRQQGDVRLQAGLLMGDLAACVAWVAQLLSGRMRWWLTGLCAGALPILIVALVHIALGGAPDLVANVAAGLGLEAGALAAILTGGGLHLLSYGFGWPRRPDDPESGDTGIGDSAEPRSPDAPKADGARHGTDGERMPGLARGDTLIRWVVGTGITIAAGWRAAAWQGEAGMDRLASAITYPLWLFALVGAALWWSRNTRRHIPTVMAAVSVLVAAGHFLLASARSADPNPARPEVVDSSAVPEDEAARLRRLRRRLDSISREP